MPYISTEALVGGALLIVLALGYQCLSHSASSSAPKSKKKNKKRAKGNSGEEVKEVAGAQAEGVKKGKRGKKGGGRVNGTGGQAQPPTRHEDMPAPPTPVAEEVEAQSFAEVASSSQPSKPKTLAEKIAPKQRKTKVDDMLALEDRPASHARVMKIASSAAPPVVPSLDEKTIKFENDYTDGSEEDTSAAGTVEDDGWDVVPSRKMNVSSCNAEPMSLSLSSSAQTQSTSLPLPTETKTQRKNAKKAEAKRAAKAADEAERLRRLAMHRRDLEREKINAIYSKRGGTSGSKTLGGAKATLDTNGKLIWE